MYVCFRTKEEEDLVHFVFTLNTFLGYEHVTGYKTVYLFDHLLSKYVMDSQKDVLIAVCFFLSSRRYEYFYLSVESTISKFKLKIQTAEFTNLADTVFKKIYMFVESFTPEYNSNLTYVMEKSSYPSFLPLDSWSSSNTELAFTYFDSISLDSQKRKEEQKDKHKEDKHKEDKHKEDKHKEDKHKEDKEKKDKHKEDKEDKHKEDKEDKHKEDKEDKHKEDNTDNTDDNSILKYLNSIEEGSFGLISRELEVKTNTIIAVKRAKIPFCPSVIKEISILSNLKRKGPFVEILECLSSAFSMTCYSVDLLNASNSLTFSKRCTITSQLETAISKLHSLGYMHRDLSPANILLDQYKNVVIADFGTAERIDLVKTQRSQEIDPGNYLFAPIEVLNKKRYNESVDVWALGCIVYYLFTSDLPFYNSNPNAQIYTIRSGIDLVREKIELGLSKKTLPKHVYDVLEYSLRIENRPKSPPIC